MENKTTIFDSITTLQWEEHPVRKIVNRNRERSSKKEEDEEEEEEKEATEGPPPKRELFAILILPSLPFGWAHI